MRLRSLPRLALALAAALSFTACSDSDPEPGRIIVRLTDGPSVDYDKILLDIRDVEIHGEDGWQVLGSPNKRVDLLSLQNGVTETLIPEKFIEAGHYTQMRLVLGPDNDVILKGETEEKPLVVPSGQQSGVKLNVNFDVDEGTTRDVVIDIQAARSVFVHRTGASEKYILRPVVFAYDVFRTGSISGVLTDEDTGQPLAGAQVFAEAFDTSGAMIHFSYAVTDATGTYRLGYLPKDRAYHVVSQPVVGSTAYAAEASDPIAISEASPTPTWSNAFKTTPSGTLNVTISNPLPATSSATDEVFLARKLTTAAGEKEFIVQTTDANVAETTVSIPTVAVGDYSAWLLRGPGADQQFVASTPVPVTVGTLLPASVELTGPTLP